MNLLQSASTLNPCQHGLSCEQGATVESMLALLKAQVSLHLGKLFSSDNEVLVCIMYLYMYWLLQNDTAKTEIKFYILPTCMSAF